MAADASFLLLTAASVGVVHTLLGPDHYLPFIFMSRSLGWSLQRTLLVTLLCGLGHVLGSIALGAVGIALGVALTRLEIIESARGEVAAWLMIAFGIAYAAWGLRRAHRQRPHAHVHVHPDGIVHRHDHVHAREHVHVHAPEHVQVRTPEHVQVGTPEHIHAHAHAHAPATLPQADAPRLATVTPWILFTIFVFGPCEALVPLLMYPASQHSVLGAVGVTAVFAVATLATMSVLVMLGHMGLERWRLTRLERYTHALAGAAIACCGVAIRFLGL